MAAATAGGNHRRRWLKGVIKQVTKSNFAVLLQQFKSHIKNAVFIAVSTKKTGDSSVSDRHPWRRVLPFESPEIAYLKAKRAAESYEILQFAVCPFRIVEGSKIQAFPYNFHLFPRDEHNLGSLVQSLKELIAAGGAYGSRSSLTVDVCSHRQVQLALQAINNVSDDLVTLVVRDKAGEPNLVRVVLTNSEEDKRKLLDEIQNTEEEQNLKIRGFREVIDVIAGSHKPVVGYNCLHEFTFIHSKFIAPLPPSLGEFMCSLRLAFSNVVDLNYLMKEIGPLRKAKNLPSALAYLKRQFFVPIDFEFPSLDEGNGDNDHGHIVLRNVKFFAKLTRLLTDSHAGHDNCIAIEDYSNIFYPISTVLSNPSDDDFSCWIDDARKMTSDSLLFIWGFSHLSSAKELKGSLKGVHFVFKEEFELQVVDKTCVAVVFGKSGYAEVLLKEIKSGNIHSDVLSWLISEGVKIAGYEAYRKVCMLGLWDADLADSLDVVLSQPKDYPSSFTGKDASKIHCRNDSKINLNDL